MDKTDVFFKTKIESLYASVERDAYPKFTSFLNEHQIALVHETLRHKSGYSFYGGYEEAGRCMLGIFPDYMEPETESFPLSIVHLDYPKGQLLTHRDVLGSFMALQLKREMVGDIVFQEGAAEVAIAEHLGPMIVEQLKKVGQVGVQLTLMKQMTFAPQAKFQTLEGTVASLRLDNMVAFVTRLSRSKAVQLLQSGRVFVNHMEKTESDLLLKQGDTFNIRGYGKFLFSEPTRMTKKMRCYVTIYQYI